jgi:hypothetical protein
MCNCKNYKTFLPYNSIISIFCFLEFWGLINSFPLLSEGIEESLPFLFLKRFYSPENTFLAGLDNKKVLIL